MIPGRGFGLSLFLYVVLQNNEPWFVAADVCRALDIQNHKDAIKRLDDDEKSGVVLTDPHGRPQETNCVNEPGLYSLVLGNKKVEARTSTKFLNKNSKRP